MRKWPKVLARVWQDDYWRPYWETTEWTGPFWQFWRRCEVRVLQNRLVDLNGPLR